MPASLKMTIGQDGQRNSNGMPGLIDDFRLYNRALSASEVSNLASSQIAYAGGTAVAGVSTKAAFVRSLSIGSAGSDVTQLQSLLKELGYYTYPEATGYYGKATQSAVSAFQTANGLDSVGIVGPKTLRALNALLAE